MGTRPTDSQKRTAEEGRLQEAWEQRESRRWESGCRLFRPASGVKDNVAR